jgi:hypothetical protein
MHHYYKHSNEIDFELFLIQKLSLSKIPTDILTKFDLNYNEFLIIKGFTLKHTLDLIGLIGSGSDFPTAFEKTYSMSTTQYFSELRTYLKTLNHGW